MNVQLFEPKCLVTEIQKQIFFLIYFLFEEGESEPKNKKKKNKGVFVAEFVFRRHRRTAAKEQKRVHFLFGNLTVGLLPFRIGDLSVSHKPNSSGPHRKV